MDTYLYAYINYKIYYINLLKNVHYNYNVHKYINHLNYKDKHPKFLHQFKNH